LEHGPMVLFSSSGPAVREGEASLPDLDCDSLIITSLRPESIYELNFGGLNISSNPAAVLPGVSAGTARVRANEKGIVRIERGELGNLRLRIAGI